MNKIMFYLPRAENGILSNFFPDPLTHDGAVYPTPEHLYQAAKFLEPEHRELIRTTKSPKESKILAHKLRRFWREDWNSPALISADDQTRWQDLTEPVLVKDFEMLMIIRARVNQNENFRRVLLETGDAVLTEHTALDNYWADGGTGSGVNRLGQILMLVRAEIRSRF